MKDAVQSDEKLDYIQIISNTHSKLSPNNPSGYYQEYSQTFKDLSTSDINKETLIKVLLSNGFEYTTLSNDYIFGVRVIRYTPNYEVICLKVEYGPFSFECNILNVQQKSIVHSLPQIKSSEGCCIYLESSSLDNTVIKCFPIKQDTIFQQLFIKIIKQYAIFKIASCLDIGPRQGLLKSFQIIVYEDCIQFMMQECQLSHKLHTDYFKDRHWNKLKEKLYKLHLLQIVHMDIKPSNICFSPSMNELVFIDFGLSNVIEEKIGFKTGTRFAGSLNFCSPDMKECYNSQIAMQIDLYYNDLYGLVASSNELSKHESESECLDSEQSIENIQFGDKNITEMTKNSIKTKMNLFKLKNLIYNNQIDQIMKNEQYKQYLIYYFQQFLEFIYHLPYGITIEKIHKFIQSNKKVQTEYVLIKKQSVQNYSIFKLQSTQECQKKILFRQFFKGIYLSKVDLDDNKLAQQTNDNVKLLLLNEKNIKPLKKSIYFQRLAQFISLKLFLSTFNEKIAAIHILNKLYHINVGDNDDEIKVLKKGSLYLLQYFIQEQNLYFKRQIPLLFFNLIILQRSRQCIEQLFMRIAKKQMKIQDCQFIILKCYNCSFWHQQYNLQYKQSKKLIDRILQICKQALRSKLKEVNKQDKCYQSLNYTYQIVNYYQCHCVPYILYQKSSQLHKIKYIDEQLKHQIIIYIQSMLIQESPRTRIIRYNNTIDQVTLIDQASLYFNKKQLEYFHCLIFKFFRSNNNNKGMTAILNKISKYFGNYILVEKLYIHQQYVQRQFYYSDRDRKQYLLSLLQMIQRDPKDQESRLILFYGPVSLLRSSHKINHLDQQSFELMEIIRRHMIGIFKIMPRQQIGQFIARYKKIKDHQQWYLEYIRIMTEFYWLEPQFATFFKDFLQIYEESTKCNKCKVCVQHFRQVFLITKIQYLKYIKNDQQLLNLLDFCIQNKSKGWTKKIILTCLFDMIDFLENNSALAGQLQKRVSNVIKWIEINDSWQELLYKPLEQTRDFNIVYGYLLKNEMDECFCLVQVRLTQILGKYPSQEMMTMYSKSLLNAYFDWEQQVNNLAVYVSTHQLFKVTQEISQYYAIFISYLLIFKKLQDTYENKFILFILRNTNKLNSMGKEIIIKNLLFYFARFSFVNYEESVSKRKAKKIWRMYFRVPIIQATSDELQRYYFNNIKNRKIPKFIKKNMHRKFIQFQEKIKFKDEHKCESLSHLFTSPFYEE